jgi:hypothetical protein
LHDGCNDYTGRAAGGATAKKVTSVVTDQAAVLRTGNPPHKTHKQTKYSKDDMAGAVWQTQYDRESSHCGRFNPYKEVETASHPVEMVGQVRDP